MNELYHYGIKGMRWGIRNAETKARYKRDGFRIRGIRTVIADHQNRKVRESFDKWKQSDAAKKDAIEKGKNANDSRLAYNKDRTNRELKEKYKSDQKEYKQALRKNTIYRKGSVREEVLKDSAHKNQVEAKRIRKQLDSDPTNKELRRTYNKLQDIHDIDLAKSRRVQKTAANRSQLVANMRRARTMAVKAVVASAAVSGGAYVLNKYGKVEITADTIQKGAGIAKEVLKMAKYF